MVWPFDTKNADGGPPQDASSQDEDASQDRAQVRDARQLLINNKARVDEIGAWSLMNANLQAHQVTAKAAGLDPAKSVIPWGTTNTVTHNIHQGQTAGGLIAKTVLAAVAALGLGAGTAGLASLAGLLGTRGGVPPPPASLEVEYEWILEVERNHELSSTADRHIRSSQGSRSGSAANAQRDSREDP